MGVRGHHGLEVARGKRKQHGPQFGDGRSEAQQLPAMRHAEERDVDIVAAAGGVHLAGQVPAGAPQKAFDEEEQVLAGAVVAGARDLFEVEAVERLEKQLLLGGGQNPLGRQHAGVRIVNLEQRIEEVPLSLFEIRAEDGLGIDGRGELAHWLPALHAGFLARLTKFARMR